MGEHTKYQMEYIESVDGCAHQSAVDIIGALEQQCDELAEALQEAIGIIDCLRDYVCEGGSIALIGAISSVREANDFMEGKARAALAKHRQPQEEAPELFPGTLEKLRDLGKKENALLEYDYLDFNEREDAEAEYTRRKPAAWTAARSAIAAAEGEK